MHIINKTKNPMEKSRQKFIELGREFQDLAKTCRQAARLVDEIHAGNQTNIGKKVRRLQELAKTVADALRRKSMSVPSAPTKSP